MSKRTDANAYTIFFAIGMVIVVGALLAFTASSLKDTIQKNKELEIQQNILYAMGVNQNDERSAIFVSSEETPSLFEQYITKQLVILGDEVLEDEQAYLIDIKVEQDKAKRGELRRLPLFIGEKDGETFYIVPIRGKGLWDAIWAYISFDEQMVVRGVYFDHKGETPGLGANIKERFFMDDFIGEHLLNSRGAFQGINISKSNGDPINRDKTDHEVDAIAGSTITGDGVSAMIKSELSLYVPYFKTLEK